jgi:branched-subunit amino acid ABC-type transport system permease component
MEIFLQLIINSIIVGSIYLLVALGFNFIYGTAHFFDMSYGGIVIVGGYLAFYFLKIINIPLYISIPISIFLTGLLGMLLYLLIYKPLQKRRASGMVLLVASFGLYIFIEAVLSILFSNQFQVLYTNPASDIIKVFGSGIITEIQLKIVSIAMLVTGILYLLINKSNIGKLIRSINNNREAAVVVGVDIEKIIA